MADDNFTLPEKPQIPGLKSRGFILEKDCPGIADVISAMREVDHYDYVPDAAELFKEFGAEAKKRDLARDILIVEVDGAVVGESFVSWDDAPTGERLYQLDANLVPGLRRTGLRRSMLLWAERRARELAAGHPPEVPKLLHVFVDAGEDDWRALLESSGYRIFRHGCKMVRPDLNNIPEFPLPAGVETRKVEPAHYEKIRKAWNEACKDMRGQIPIDDVNFKGWSEFPTFDPTLWQIAWHGDDVVGTVFGMINAKENEMNGRKRGLTELISVARPWRGRGIAKALMARCMAELRARGMTEAGLGVDAENPSGALKLYEKMGFRVVKQVTFYRKPL
jgi:ribosomal protein S18 acetylase RimI-like enzyme